MRKYIFTAIVIIAALIISCRKQSSPTPQQSKVTAHATADSIKSDSEAEKIDFTMSDMNGKVQSVATEAARHKLTIIDFWASWCGPCREEMPRLVHLYNMYNDSGLGVIGISLDENREQWETAVNNMNMSWMQLSDLQGWDNAAAVKYDVESIPFTIVVDSNSRVIATGLRGEQLADLVERTLGK